MAKSTKDVSGQGSLGSLVSKNPMEGPMKRAGKDRESFGKQQKAVLARDIFLGNERNTTQYDTQGFPEFQAKNLTAPNKTISMVPETKANTGMQLGTGTKSIPVKASMSEFGMSSGLPPRKGRTSLSERSDNIAGVLTGSRAARGSKGLSGALQGHSGAIHTASRALEFTHGLTHHMAGRNAEILRAYQAANQAA